jgi:hypothetical protein
MPLEVCEKNEEARKVQKVKKLYAVIAILLATTLSTALAALLLTHQITTTLIVKPTVSMGVFSEDGKTPLNSLDLGQFQLGSEYYFPGHVESPPLQHFYINNTDQQSFYISFDVEPYSQYIAFNFWIKRGDQAEYTLIQIGSGAIYQFPIESHLVNPDPQTQYATWYFKITINQGIEFGTYTPTIQVKAYDSSSG